jgi:hypothetical protein
MLNPRLVILCLLIRHPPPPTPFSVPSQLRLDFAITASEDLKGGRGIKVHDSFICHEATVGYSDHAPIGVVLDVDV